MTGGSLRRRKRATNTGQSAFNFDAYEEEEEGIEDPDALETDFKNREEMQMIMAQYDPEDLVEYGHAFENFVLACTYRGIPCRYVPSLKNRSQL